LWRSNQKGRRRANPARNQRGIISCADKDLEIESLFDHVGDIIPQDEIDRQLFMLVQQAPKLTAEIKPERNWNTQADAADGFAPAPAQRFPQGISRIDELLGREQQILPLVSQRNRVCAPLNQSSAEMLFKRTDLP
jgi:hypothetical protein